MAVTLLALAFGFAVDMTASPKFWTREKGQEILTAWWPLSAPALQVGAASLDREVQRRCFRAEPPHWREDLFAVCFLTRASERDGLPVARPEMVPEGRPEWFRLGVMRAARAHGIDTSSDYYFGESAFWAHPTGYDYTRCKLAGVWPERLEGWLDVWQPDAMRAKWAKRKGR